MIHIITLDGFSPFHSSFMVIDGFMEPGHVKAETSSWREKEGSGRAEEKLMSEWIDGPTG